MLLRYPALGAGTRFMAFLIADFLANGVLALSIFHSRTIAIQRSTFVPCERSRIPAE